MNAQNFRQKREQIHKLRSRNTDLLQETKRISEHNAGIEKKIIELESHIRKFRQINVELAQKLEEEWLKESEFKDRVVRMEKSVNELESNYRTQKSRYDEKAIETERLERELIKLQAKKRAYEKHISLAKSNELALDTRANAIKTKALEIDRLLKSGGEAPKTATPSLKDRISRIAGKNQKEASALFNCAQAVISNIEENEFEGVKYKTRVNKNSKKIGARIYFYNVTTQYADLVKQLSPVINELGRSFGPMGVEINTKALKSANGVVSALDVTLLMRLGHRKEAIQQL